MKPPPLHYVRAHDPDEAVALLAECVDEAKVIAGGQSLVPLLNFRLARPSVLVDIAAVTPWALVRHDERSLVLGALTTHLRIERAAGSEPFRGLEVLPRTARLIGHLPIRTRGTIGGSLAHGDPAAEWCVLALLLGAEVTVRSSRGERRIPAELLLQGFLTTGIEPDEILTAVEFPRTEAVSSLREHAPRHGDFALVAAAVSAELTAGVCRAPRVVLGGVAPTPVRVREAEEALSGRELTPALVADVAAVAADAVDPPGDAHASSAHRRRLVATLVARALGDVSGFPVPAGVAA